MKTLPKIGSLIICFCSITPLLHAQAPQIINYQGRVLAGTTNFNGTGQFKFALVNTNGLTTYWSNDGTSVNGSEPTNAVSLGVSNGLYSVLLGDTSLSNMMTIPPTVFSNSDVRLRVWFNDGSHGSQLLSPDQRIVSVGYAVLATSVPDGAITTAKIGNGAVTSSKIDTATVQQRVTGTAPGGSFITGINANGTVTSAAGNVGTITGVAAGTGLSGGGSSGSVSLGIANGGVGSAQIASGSVTGTQIDSTTVQRRVTGTAPGGSFLTGINQDGTVTSAAGGSSIWSLNGSSAYYTSGNVGIGTMSPQQKLDVFDGSGPGGSGGNMHIGGYSANGDAKLIHFGDLGFVYIGENVADDLLELRAGKFYFNNGNVGIGTNAPSTKLDVFDGSGAGGTGGNIHVGGYSAGGDPKLIQFGDLQGSGPAYVYVGENGADDLLELRAGKFYFNNGNVGIGTNAPSTKLQVAGDTRVDGRLSINTTPGVNSTVMINPFSGQGVPLRVNNSSGASVLSVDLTAGGTFINGDAHISGTLFKGAGSFKIDHPLDPANKYLSHSFVESPDMMNIYNGNVTTDSLGNAVVELPDWFEALNKDFRYQLTIVGEQFARVRVSSKIKDSRFSIQTDRAFVEVSWQVTGIRKDAYAETHRIQVEENKPPEERGMYMHPELFGQPESSRIHHEQTKPPGNEK
jgi:hypothetical protein